MSTTNTTYPDTLDKQAAAKAEQSMLDGDLALAREIAVKLCELSAVLRTIAPYIDRTSIDLSLFADRTHRQAAIILGELSRRK